MYMYIYITVSVRKKSFVLKRYTALTLTNMALMYLWDSPMVTACLESEKKV